MVIFYHSHYGTQGNNEKPQTIFWLTLLLRHSFFGLVDRDNARTNSTRGDETTLSSHSVNVKLLSYLSQLKT
jgi:hypothetical protein